MTKTAHIGMLYALYTIMSGSNRLMRSNHMKNQNRKGFTLLEIMIVVAILGLLATIAIPSFISARIRTQENSCINNLRQIDNSKDLYALDNDNASATMADLVPNYLKRLPDCNGGGIYTINELGTDPTCTIAGHGL
jgi:prepilin-type N-terminal cleavage/methylation domain-containing protein